MQGMVVGSKVGCWASGLDVHDETGPSSTAAVVLGGTVPGGTAGLLAVSVVVPGGVPEGIVVEVGTGEG